MKFDWQPIKVNKDRNELANNLGNPELAKNKEIYGVLSDPEFIKTFPGPADFQYDLIRESLISSKENAINGIAYLKDYIKTSDNPLFCLVRLSRFLHTALGNQKSLANSKEQKEISEILEKGFKDITSDDETKYFLSVNLNPDIILKQTQSFEGQERSLTPIHLSEGYFVQDNGFDPIPIFYHTDNLKDLNSLIEEQKKFFENARPENRPEMSKNPTWKEMMAYKEKYLNPIINFSEIKKEIREKIKNSTDRLKPEEIQKFFPSSHNTFELIQDPLMFEFRAFINPEIRSSIEKEFGIDLKEIPLKEQVYFLTSITNRTNKTIKPVQNFTKEFGPLGLRTFLSIEQGGREMGDKILALGEKEKLPKEIAEKIFTKYGEMIDTADNIENEIRKIFGGKEVPLKVLTSVKETLLKRGAKMLSDLGDKVLNPKFIINEQEILRELDEIKEEIIILGESYVGLYKEGIRVPIQDVTTIKETPTENLTEEQKKELMKIYEKGRPKVTYDKKGHLEFLKNEFEEELNDKDVSVTEICFKGETIIIALVDRKDKNSLYIGGLTFVEDVKNSVVAEASMSYVLEKFKDHNIKALVDSRNPIIRMYINRFGFRITKKLESEEEVKNNGGEIYYEIERPKDEIKEKKIEERQKLGNVA